MPAPSVPRGMARLGRRCRRRRPMSLRSAVRRPYVLGRPSPALSRACRALPLRRRAPCGQGGALRPPRRGGGSHNRARAATVPSLRSARAARLPRAPGGARAPYGARRLSAGASSAWSRGHALPRANARRPLCGSLPAGTCTCLHRLHSAPPGGGALIPPLSARAAGARGASSGPGARRRRRWPPRPLRGRSGGGCHEKPKGFGPSVPQNRSPPQGRAAARCLRQP